MKIDLEKELAIQLAPQKTPAWIKFIAAICFLNFLLVIILFFSNNNNNSVQEKNKPDSSNLIDIKKMSARLNSLEKTFRELKVNQKHTKKTLSVVAAKHDVSKRKDRMFKRELKKAGLTEKEMRKAIRKTIFPTQEDIQLTSQDKNNINSLIDSDDTSLGVRDFVASVTNTFKQTAYLEYLRNKGDEWLDVALPLVSEDRILFDEYLDNALYFYDIVSAISKNNAMIAYVEAKKNQADLAVQNDDIQIKNEENQNQKDIIADIKKELEPKMSNDEVMNELRGRRKHIKKYPTSDIIRKYNSDWETDPRKRLEQKRKEEKNSK